jgi:isopentenyl-diphosphate delta-isomerase
MTELVVLVNEQDEQLGTMEKMEAHRSPHLHRAFSVFLFNSQGKMLLQQRAFKKYHSPGLWTNTCCSHPRPGEETEAAALRRLHEEMGISTSIHHAFSFVYQAQFDNGLMEHEFDHVFIGQYNGAIAPNEAEVAGYCFKALEEIKADIAVKPQYYTEWFKIALPQLEAYMQEQHLLVA